MSYLEFATESGEANLAGPERHWLSNLAYGPAMAAWDLDDGGTLERVETILEMVPEVPDGEHGANFLHNQLREAQAADAVRRRVWSGWQPGTPMPVGSYDYEPLWRAARSLRTSLGVTGDLTFHVAGHTLSCRNVALNTALAAGSDPVRLSSKLSGWAHCLIEGEDRAWLADIIDAGLEGGMFRRALPGGRGMNWDQVAEMLRSRDDEPVVTSHSTDETFPTMELAGMMPPWPAPGQPETHEGYNALPEDVREAYDDEIGRRTEAWYELPAQEQWSRALEGLRTRRWWCRLSPDTLGKVTFGAAVTVYHMLSPERDERVRKAFAAVEALAGKP